MKILISTLSDIGSDPRPNRMMNLLADEHDVSILDLSRKLTDDGRLQEHHRLKMEGSSKPQRVLQLLRLLMLADDSYIFKAYYCKEIASLHNEFDLIICHDFFQITPIFTKEISVMFAFC